MTKNINVFIDERWPSHSSVAFVCEQYKYFAPPEITTHQLDIAGRIGSPFSPLYITQAISRSCNEPNSIFFNPGFVPPLYARIPSVVIIHDLTHRHTYGPLKRFYYDVIYKTLYKRCSAIICVSEFTKNEVVNWSGIDPSKIHVVYNGAPDIGADGPKHKHDKPYIFYCGNHRAHKNLHRTVEAFCRSKLPEAGIDFILTNGPNAALIDIAEQFGLSDRVKFTGYLDDENLASYIRGSKALIYASLFEGFGLPILEGYSADTPVLTSNTASMPEIADGGAKLVDPLSTQSITEGMNSIIFDGELRRKLINRGRIRIKDFSWNRAAREVWQVLDTLV